jgi:hypothetical protein
MHLLSYLIRYFFKQQIFFVKHWDWYIGNIKNTHDFSFLKGNRIRDFSPKKQ